MGDFNEDSPIYISVHFPRELIEQERLVEAPVIGLENFEKSQYRISSLLRKLFYRD